MRPRTITTDTAPKPFSNYSQAVEVAAGSRLLHIAGQVGATLDGTIPEDEREQHELAWANVLAILNAARMDETNLVDCHVYLTNPASVGLYREVRDRMLKGAKPAATLLIVAGLASPAIKVEVSAVAAE
jgi:enamine deaminase RidA (YjgF/YER057c/UK114 family)